jgi:hypothetical protein
MQKQITISTEVFEALLNYAIAAEMTPSEAGDEALQDWLETIGTARLEDIAETCAQSYRVAMSREPGDFSEEGGLVVPCPNCCEARADFLIWLDDENVRCVSCGRTFRPEQN